MSAVADRVVQAVPAGADPELDGVLVGHLRQLLRGHDAAEGGGPGVQGVVVAEQQPAHGRARPVGADDEIGGGGRVVGEVQHRLGGGLGDVDEPLAQVHPLAAERVEQDRLHVDAVDADVRRSVAGAVVAAHLGDDAAVTAVAVDERLDLEPLLRELVGEAEEPLVEA